MIRSKSMVFSMVLVAGSFALAAVLYSRMPEQVPTHWNVHGIANRFMNKQWGAFLLPGSCAAIAVLMSVLPRVSPRGYELERFARVYGTLRIVMVGALAYFAVLTTFRQAGIQLPISQAAEAGFGLGVLWIVLGNYLSKVTRNFFVGIRTPWTLANEEVWLRTHRFGAKAFALGGVAMLVLTVLYPSLPVIVSVAVLSGVAALPWSYYVYRQVGAEKHAEL